MDTSLKWTPEIDPYLSLLHLVDSILRWTHTRSYRAGPKGVHIKES